MKSKLLIAVLCVAGMSNANAFDTLGMPNCGRWIKNKENSKPNSPTWQDVVNNAWLMGYLSGLNADERKGNFLAKASGEQLTLWMENYCKAHPLNDLADGSQALASELMKKK